MGTEVDVGLCEREIIARVEALADRSIGALRAMRKEYSKRLQGADPDAVVELALRLQRQHSYDYRFIAQELVANHRRARARLDESLLVRLAEPLRCWKSVDTFALELAGPAWHAGQIGDGLIERWARSADRWWRRAALVCTVPLNLRSRGGVGDAERTLRICSLLIDDRDDMVVKAMSWALRVLSERDRTVVAQFLARHEGRLAPRVLREVRNKLATGLKNPRKR